MTTTMRAWRVRRPGPKRTNPLDWDVAAPVPAPEVGEHTAAILAALGYSDADVESLVRQRVAFPRTT